MKETLECCRGKPCDLSMSKQLIIVRSKKTHLTRRNIGQHQTQGGQLLTQLGGVRGEQRGGKKIDH